MSASVALSVLEVEHLARSVLIAHGSGETSAAAVARSIAAAERDGISSHGLAYLPTYCEHLHCGKVDGAAEPNLVRSAPAVLTVDARCGFAQPAIELGVRELCPLANAHGVAALAIRNSYNCGVLAHHTALIAEAGLVGLGFTNAPASIAPLGTSTPLLGTNPWSLAVPARDAARGFIVDQSASVVAKSEVAKRARAKEQIPLGWALDATGQPTTDPDAALKGSMVPNGGYKGVGAALLTEVMAACLTGATLGVAASPFSGVLGGPPRTGQFFLAIAPGPSSGGAFFERVAQLEHAFDKQPGARLPGSGRARARAHSAKHGISIDHALHSRIQQLLAQPRATPSVRNPS